MSLMICSDDDGRPAGFCLISTPQVRMNKNTLLNQNYICSIGADGVHLYCLSCNRWGEANLDQLIQVGLGDKPVIEARFRCRDCGEIVEKQVRPPVPSFGSAVGYICSIRAP